MWNGYDARSTVGGLEHASVQPIAERGIAGRGILLDMARYRGKEYLGKGETFTKEDLIGCAQAQGIEIEKRDILVIRTNFLQLFFDEGAKFYDGFCEPGRGHTPALVGGTWGLTPWPTRSPTTRPQAQRCSCTTPSCATWEWPSPRSLTSSAWRPTARPTTSTASSTRPHR